VNILDITAMDLLREHYQRLAHVSKCLGCKAPVFQAFLFPSKNSTSASFDLAVLDGDLVGVFAEDDQLHVTQRVRRHRCG
jgi:hypothetical protein